MPWAVMLVAYWLTGVAILVRRSKPMLVHWSDWCLAVMVAAWFWPWFRRSE